MPPSEPLDLSTLERASFRIVRRGFATTEVRDLLTRAAAEIAELRRVRDELHARLAEAEDALSGSGPGLLEAHRVASALGVEASQVLEAAHVAATERAERAEREAQAVRDEATQAAEQLRSGAAEDAEAMRSEGSAQRDEIVAEAESEAERVVSDARSRGREMVREAQTVRERMLRDLGRKRHSGRVQVEQLRAGRDRLLESLSVVQDNLESALGDLVASVPEARKAAEWAGLRISEQPESTPIELEAEIEAARLVDHPLTDPGDAPFDHDADEAGVGDAAERAGGQGFDEPSLAEAGELSDIDAALAPVEDTEPAEDTGAAQDTGPSGAAAPEGIATSSDDAATPDDAGHDLSGDIFARLRSAEAASADPEQAVEPDDDSTPAPAMADEGRPGAGPGRPGSEGGPADPDEPSAELQSARAEAEDTVTRALKKVLVDEQSSLLHRIRSKGEQALSELLSSPDRHAPYRDVLMPALRGLAATAGASESLDLSEAVERFFELAIEPVDLRLRELLDSEPEPDELAAGARSLYRESRSHRMADAVSAALDAALDTAALAAA